MSATCGDELTGPARVDLPVDESNARERTLSRKRDGET